MGRVKNMKRHFKRRWWFVKNFSFMRIDLLIIFLGCSLGCKSIRVGGTGKVGGVRGGGTVEIPVPKLP